MKEYIYETHLHTMPVSRCARADVRENLMFYKELGYDGVFITNHFIDGNMTCNEPLSYEEKINFYFSDYELGVEIGKELGIKVFPGLESTYQGMDFLIYGLDKAWFLAHPEIMGMKRSQFLATLMEAGALVIQAHPFREASYIDHIRLFPRHVHGVEMYNAGCCEFENFMAEHYVKQYGLIPFAGSDNHRAAQQTVLYGMRSEAPVKDEAAFISKIKSGEMTPFRRDVSQ